MNLLSQKVF